MTTCRSPQGRAGLARRINYSLITGLLGTCRPTHTPAVGLVHRRMALVEVDTSAHLDATTDVFQQGDCTHAQATALFIQTNLNRGLTRDMDRHNTVGFPPVRCAFINECEHQDPPNFTPVLTVDMEPFAIAYGAGTVITFELNVGVVIQLAEAIAQRLNATLGPVLQLVKAPDIQVNGVVAREKTAALAFIPVQVD